MPELTKSLDKVLDCEITMFKTKYVNPRTGTIVIICSSMAECDTDAELTAYEESGADPCWEVDL